jgi:two-component system phosphate regulon response regulator PhoB/two-component system alkaline phosphatase synthesis response regulator PhoP
LILLDIELPDGSGLELCSELADDPATSAIPVVIVSGTEQSDVIRAARRAGSRFFLCKPYDPNALLLIAEHSIREADRWI